MKKAKKSVAEIIQKVVKHMAVMACGTASHYGGYQAKEPKNIFK
jgi:cyclic lactone autoinducer peptide